MKKIVLEREKNADMSLSRTGVSFSLNTVQSFIYLNSKVIVTNQYTYFHTNDSKKRKIALTRKKPVCKT